MGSHSFALIGFVPFGAPLSRAAAELFAHDECFLPRI